MWDSVKPYLKEAHFSPVKQRINFKISLLTFKCINNIAPDYMKKGILVEEQPARLMRHDSRTSFYLMSLL